MLLTLKKIIISVIFLSIKVVDTIVKIVSFNNYELEWKGTLVNQNKFAKAIRLKFSEIHKIYLINSKIFNNQVDTQAKQIWLG